MLLRKSIINWLANMPDAFKANLYTRLSQKEFYKSTFLKFFSFSIDQWLQLEHEIYWKCPRGKSRKKIWGVKNTKRRGLFQSAFLSKIQEGEACFIALCSKIIRVQIDFRHYLNIEIIRLRLWVLTQKGCD